jgi:hypothetical protein
MFCQIVLEVKSEFECECIKNFKRVRYFRKNIYFNKKVQDKFKKNERSLQQFVEVLVT